MKKILSLIFIFILLAPLIFADGMVIDPHGYLPENQQLAAINYENGLEKLIVSIQTDEIRDDKTAWIFPVPGDPNKVVIDVVPQFPQFYGSNVLQEAENTLSRLTNYLNYPFIINLLFSRIGSRGALLATESMSTKGIRVSGGDVTVYEHIEKYGVTTEIIGAKTGLNIYVYLGNKGLDPKFAIAGVLNDYIEKDYTFVVSWINKQQPSLDGTNINYNGIEGEAPSRYMPYRRLGVMAMFPTDKIFYPLIPTSVYGSKNIPTTLYVTDYVTPEVNDDLKSFVSTTYYKSSNYYPQQELASFFGSNDKRTLKYTRIDINAPSKYFTEDLYINPGAPANVYYASTLNLFIKSSIFVFILVAILSALVSSLLGWILFKKPWEFALVGLANLLTIIGLIITLIFVKTRKPNIELQKKIKEEGFLVIGDGLKKLIFIILFVIIYIISTFLLTFLLKLPL